MLRHLLAPQARTMSRWCRSILPRKTGFRILIFHDVLPSEREAFKALILFLTENQMLISPDQAMAWVSEKIPDEINQGKSNQHYVLSFDDGFIGNYEIAAEVLSPRGIKALFFVCPVLVNLHKTAQFDAISNNIVPDFLKSGRDIQQMQLMDWEQIKDLDCAGHTIGAHGMTHQALNTLHGEALRYEILTSAEILENQISKAVNWYAYAFGGVKNISAAALEIIAQQFPMCRSGVRGLNNRATDSHALFADHVDLSAPEPYQHLILEGGLDPAYALKRKQLRTMLQKQKVA